MTTATEILQSIADAWAAKLGGKIQVGLQILVHAGPEMRRPYFCAQIGENLTQDWQFCTPNGLEYAMSESERAWKLDGSPTRAEDAERVRLLARCRELGIQVENCGATVEN